MNTLSPAAKEIALLWMQCCDDVIEGKVLHAFTWNPDPSRYASTEPTAQYDACIANKLFLAQKCLQTFCFIPELTSNGNVHIHGFYTVKDPAKYYKVFLPKVKRQGYVVVKKTKVDDKWLDYCMKDVDDNQYIFDESVFEYPFTSSSEEVDDISCMKIRQCFTKLRFKKSKAWNAPKRRSIMDYEIFKGEDDSDSE